jgi:hypothetical protein
MNDLRPTACDFHVYWPPQDPEEAVKQSTKPLLNGTLSVVPEVQPRDVTALRLAITLTRPSEETDRAHWNSALAYAYMDWMEQVRVWDEKQTWLWPNLPYLLRLPGREHVERYGGVDPGKGVDNDFAAVLIRKYDAAGRVESPETKAKPLVSAEWHPVGATNTDGHTIAHTAKSDEFLLHVGAEPEAARGQIKVWLIYADFLFSRPPRTWPKAKEYAGGILAYFEVDWSASPGRPCQGTVRQKRPKEGTGFDWANWVERKPDSDHSDARVRVSDAPE